MNNVSALIVRALESSFDLQDKANTNALTAELTVALLASKDASASASSRAA